MSTTILNAGPHTEIATPADLAPRTVMVPLGDGVWQFMDNNHGFLVINGEVVVLPASKTSIGIREYENNTDLSLVYASNVTSVGGNAFQRCSSLTAVILPATTSIPDGMSSTEGVFAFCSSLTTILLPVATSIGGWAFRACTALTTVSLPAATSLYLGAFYSCTALTTVSLPVASNIEQGAFSNCTSLATVSLPLATTIENFAFYSCTALTTIDLSSFTTTQVQENAAGWGIDPPSGHTVTITCSDGTVTITGD